MNGIARIRERVAVDIPVVLTTVIDSLEATLADMTEYGAMITGASLPERTRFQIDWKDQTLFAEVRWAEIDRMGVRFIVELRDGPLYKVLERAREAKTAAQMQAATPMPAPTVRAVGRGFGRRSF